MHRAAQAFHRPVIAATSEHPDDIVPAVLWPELPHYRQPGLADDELVEIKFLARLRDCLDRFWTPLSQSRVARQLATRFAALMPVLVRSAISARSSCATAERT